MQQQILDKNAPGLEVGAGQGGREGGVSLPHALTCSNRRGMRRAGAGVRTHVASGCLVVHLQARVWALFLWVRFLETVSEDMVPEVCVWGGRGGAGGGPRAPLPLF